MKQTQVGNLVSTMSSSDYRAVMKFDHETRYHAINEFFLSQFPLFSLFERHKNTKFLVNRSKSLPEILQELKYFYCITSSKMICINNSFVNSINALISFLLFLSLFISITVNYPSWHFLLVN